MTSNLLIEDLPADLMERLTSHAACNGRSVEEEVVAILETALYAEAGAPLADGWGTRLGRLFDGIGVDLDPYIQANRERLPRPPIFDDRDE